MSERIGLVGAGAMGGAPKALIGELTLTAGGAAQDVDKAHKVLRHVATNYTHLGPSGAGQTTKLFNQVLCGLGFLAVAEATQLALDAGVDAEKIPQALKGGRADSALLQEYLPRFAAKDYRRTGRIDNMVKDLNAVNDLARQTGTSMPMTALRGEIHRMLTAAGLGGGGSGRRHGIFRRGRKGGWRMITRFALFEGTIKPGQTDAFRAAVKDRLVPLWSRFPGNTDVRVMFSEARDEGAPEFPLILAISYPDKNVMNDALESDARHQSKDVTGQIVAEFFDGRIHHHVTERHDYGG